MTGIRDPIEVLLAARVTKEQFDRVRILHPRLVIRGDPGGVAIMTAEEAASPQYRHLGARLP